jgi:putative transposase
VSPTSDADLVPEPGQDDDPGHARFTYRARLSAGAERALLAEWGRCRWVWNKCVEESKTAYATRQKIGPAGLCKMLSGWRTEHAWLRAGASSWLPPRSNRSRRRDG